MIKDYLKSISLFENLTQDEVTYLSLNSKERLYKKGLIIVSEGNKRDFIYIVRKGKVKIYKSENEKNVILDIKGEHSVLGASILFSDSPNPATIMTLEDSLIYVIKTSDLEKLVVNNSSLAFDIIKILGKELVNCQEKIKSFALDDTYTKVIKLLLYLFNSYGVVLSEESIELDLILTRTEMSNLVGTSRESVSRILNQLKKEGIISIGEKKIVLLEKNKLKEWLK